MYLNSCKRNRQTTISELKDNGRIRIKIQEIVNSYIQDIEIMAIMCMQ